jgi:hypothetical protein
MLAAIYIYAEFGKRTSFLKIILFLSSCPRDNVLIVLIRLFFYKSKKYFSQNQLKIITIYFS